MTDKKALVVVTAILWAMQLLYLVSPIDLLPDFIPFLGWIDDLLGFGVTIGFTAFTVSQFVHDAAQLGSQAEVDALEYEPVDVTEIRRM